MKRYAVTFSATVEASDEKTARYFVAHLLDRGDKNKEGATMPFPHGLPTPAPVLKAYGGILAEELKA